jgi:hypothetical protein
MKNIIVFGVGKNTVKACEQGFINERNVDCYLVSDSTGRSDSFLGRPLIDLFQLSQFYRGQHIVIVSDHFQEIYRTLIKKGIPEDKLSAYLDDYYAGPHITKLERFKNPSYINIGGSYRFYFDKWINLDGSGSYLWPFSLNGDMSFPVESESISGVYSSHCFEHLDDKTIFRAIVESRRALKGNGSLVVKLPNFDEIFSGLTGGRGSQEILYKGWNFEEITSTWKGNNVEDTAFNRALFLFVSILDDEANDLFETGGINQKGYIGPPKLSASELLEIRELKSPKKVADFLMNCIKGDIDSMRFNHRNAWSSEEFVKLVCSGGFELVSLDETRIIEESDWIPDIRNMRNISSYYWFKKI